MLFLELTFSILSSWTVVAFGKWLRKLEVNLLTGYLGSTQEQRQHIEEYSPSCTDKKPLPLEHDGYVELEFPGMEFKGRSYYNLFSEDDPVCYSLSDLDEFSVSLLADLEQIDEDLYSAGPRNTHPSFIEVE